MGIATVQGRKINYQAPGGFETGSRKGHTVLLVHGATDNHKIWHSQYDYLDKENTPIAVDLPGHWRSDGPGINTDKGYRDFIKAFADAVGLAPFVFCGHSMGGSMALDFAINHPDLLKGAIMVGSSPHWELSEEEIKPWREDPEKARSKDIDNMFSKQTPSHIKEWVGKEMSGTPANICIGDLEACDTYDLDGQLDKVSLPLLVVVGDEDEYSLEGSKLVKAKVPHSTLEIVSPAGHPVMVEQSERLNSVIGTFLRTLS